MSALVKSANFPSFNSMMEDFWNAGKSLSAPFFNGNSLPSVNVSDKKDHYKVEVAAPGYKKDDFKITASNGLLTISAETSGEKKEEKDNYLRQEFFCSSFSRTFSLPEDSDEDKVDAKYKDGMLIIDIRKSARPELSKTEIKVS